MVEVLLVEFVLEREIEEKSSRLIRYEPIIYYLNSKSFEDINNPFQRV